MSDTDVKLHPIAKRDVLDKFKDVGLAIHVVLSSHPEMGRSTADGVTHRES